MQSFLTYQGQCWSNGKREKGARGKVSDEGSWKETQRKQRTHMIHFEDASAVTE
jgi:hypothetical protein